MRLHYWTTTRDYRCAYHCYCSSNSVAPSSRVSSSRRVKSVHLAKLSGIDRQIRGKFEPLPRLGAFQFGLEKLLLVFQLRRGEDGVATLELAGAHPHLPAGGRACRRIDEWLSRRLDPSQALGLGAEHGGRGTNGPLPVC